MHSYIPFSQRKLYVFIGLCKFHIWYNAHLCYHVHNFITQIYSYPILLIFRAFFNIGTGGGNPPPPPSHSVFDPIKLSLFWNSCQCNDKVGYYPWNLCERIKFWKRILRNRVLITKIMSILGDLMPAIGRFFQKKDRRDSRPTLETYQNREFVAKFFWDCFIVTDYPKTS